MAQYRNALPQLHGDFYVTDGGIETTLIFHDGLELPDFAAFHVLQTPEGTAALRRYFRSYAEIARRFGVGLILESATWRASADWGRRLGYSSESLADANREAIRLLAEVRSEYASKETAVVLSGCLGPRGDGYVADRAMSQEEAESYHRSQVEVFAETAAEMVSAITMNYAEEAVGIARAAKRAGMPVVISFTVETDGNLPTGQSLRDAIEHVDEATGMYPSYYMINCAHPTHFAPVLSVGQEDGRGRAWADRVRGVRANASRQSHAELNDASELDAGDPAELGAQYADLTQRLTRLNVMGGCCGTDHRHVEQIARACAPLIRRRG
jgi:S-methylmethionine-dependent homocysteine/selenocysteine methylase